MTKPRSIAAFALCICPAVCWPLDYQINGYLAQGALYSDGNNVYGQSTRGSTDYFEAAFSGSAALRPDLLLSAQMAIRRAGETDDGHPRVDYAFTDYRPVGDEDNAAGIRLGRVKTYLGFHNHSRDVVFTRPTILLPDSIYSDSTGQRPLLYAMEGVQVYGDLELAEQLLGFSATAVFNRKLDDLERRKLVQLSTPFTLELDDWYGAQIATSLAEGRFDLALSGLRGTFDLQTDPAHGVSGAFEIRNYTASARYNGAKVIWTSEFAFVRNDNRLNTGDAEHRMVPRQRGGYVEGRYLFDAIWSAVARIDLIATETDGKSCGQQTPARSRHECKSGDLTLGGRWLPNAQWGVWAEYHWITGSYLRYSPLDNPGRMPDHHWNLLIAMLAYRF